jgi:hypothetical protein
MAGGFYRKMTIVQDESVSLPGSGKMENGNGTRQNANPGGIDTGVDLSSRRAFAVEAFGQFGWTPALLSAP